mmetsp:Transcript_22110/g.49421  ORF Transcript_22110/g.49421 Transcript_22110/m.49421 type:complete len:205 (+) Transcript_22110:331-945(+)|eukprot:CAMPEP_0201135934 /NCGR_PEP_ID=MMETSP0850-20130426/54592_1 /ASSEMBLY_ACC=CAM_ASM_000622 /TAXON_ID=183588 /ORGANISM="Pseudo-nitzschia fraudulenta, Strain WWA7" /LENGTH=204 /DNA_ID=CAMNT_0047407157 /DNA_START=197 /DNA_END=811 /DNA_ORIENTATION=+
MTAAAIDPTKSPDDIVEDIESAEEEKKTETVVGFVTFLSSEEKAGDEDWAEAAEAALDAFYRLTKGGASTDWMLAVAAVVACLEAWKEEEAIVEVALGCIVAIASKARASDGDGGGDETATTISAKAVLETMKAFPDESTIQEQACLAIEGLALWKKTWKDELNDSEGIAEELKAALEERITNERNKSYPVKAAKALGIDDLEQ